LRGGEAAVWIGDSTERPPELLDAAILFAPVGALVVETLRSVGVAGSSSALGSHAPMPRRQLPPETVELQDIVSDCHRRDPGGISLVILF